MLLETQAAAAHHATAGSPLPRISSSDFIEYIALGNRTHPQTKTLDHYPLNLRAQRGHPKSTRPLPIEQPPAYPSLRFFQDTSSCTLLTSTVLSSRGGRSHPPTSAPSASDFSRNSNFPRRYDAAPRHIPDSIPNQLHLPPSHRCFALQIPRPSPHRIPQTLR